MSDYLTDEEQVARLKSWWAANGTSTIVGLVLVVVGVSGWRWYDGYRADAIAQASDLYQEFLVSEGDARVSIAARISSEIPDTAYHTFALMHLARDAVASGDYDGANQHLQDAISAAPRPELADIARIRLARVQQQGDRSDAALQTLGEIRSDGFRSHVAELKGDIHLARSERLLAHESYVAALANETNQSRHPILGMKIADTVDSAFVADVGSEIQQATQSDGAELLDESTVSGAGAESDVDVESDADADAGSNDQEAEAPNA
ncbi:MAG: tetratricopeptide repeat protein [Gammaproteobacteria bacterium]|nr:tetratricopeptide repeat protein [Gammaproteobacteria bacterium]